MFRKWDRNISLRIHPNPAVKYRQATCSHFSTTIKIIRRMQPNSREQWQLKSTRTHCSEYFEIHCLQISWFTANLRWSRIHRSLLAISSIAVTPRKIYCKRLAALTKKYSRHFRPIGRVSVRAVISLDGITAATYSSRWSFCAACFSRSHPNKINPVPAMEPSIGQSMPPILKPTIDARINTAPMT